jgi:sarcosine oxidase subunit alpha
VTQPYRLARGGRIDRGRVLRFRFDGREYEGHPGDTLASALLANGVRLVGRSFKYHRPRGIFSCGPEEPSALVQLGEGASVEPNCRPSQTPLYDGLIARSQNCWPGLRWDAGALADRFARFLPAGFYYKTFMAGWAWLWEPLLRRMAGLGRVPEAPDPSRYDKSHAHCDVLVIGGGPAGLAAALAAGRAGARVILADGDGEFGGPLVGRGLESERVAAILAELAAMPEVRLLPRTTVLGRYDGNYVVAAEQAPDGPARQLLWHIRAGRIVLASGAQERPIAFPDNDRPGIMLADAAAGYVARYGVAPGREVVVFTNDDSAYEAAATLAEAGVAIAAIVDLRAEPGPASRRRGHGTPFYPGHAVVATAGRHGLRRVWVQPLSDDGAAVTGRRVAIDCDLLAVSGGWNPNVQLFAHARGRLAFDAGIAALVPQAEDAEIVCVGGANGTFSLAAAIHEGSAAGTGAPLPRAEADVTPPRPVWLVPVAGGAPRSFVDLHNDVTAADIALAAREGFAAIEHVKRYTTLGMGTDQGRTGNLVGAALLSAAVGRSLAETGTTTFRPPTVPVTFGLLAGRERGALSDPVRLTPMHDWHVAAGAVFEDVGQWKRARYYPGPGESMAAAVRRECLAVRDGAAMLDASTLGKIELVGPDAAAFLERIYVNRWSNLTPGRCRYGVMCRDDGMVFDDGVGTRLAADRFLITTTTGNAATVLDWFEEWLQTEWTDLDVFCTSLTEEWTNATLAGLKSREMLAALAPSLDLADFPFMAMREADIAGIPARVFRISFSGELCYEINVPADYGLALWRRLAEAGAVPYGTEAMHVMRAEKGYFMIGHETDGSVTPVDLGLERMLARDKDFLGRRSLARRDLVRADRKQLVGLVPDDAKVLVPEGAALVAENTPGAAIVGHVTSSYFGARIGRNFALGLVKEGRARRGEQVWAPLPGGLVSMRIGAPTFYDPEGRRRDG